MPPGSTLSAGRCRVLVLIQDLLTAGIERMVVSLVNRLPETMDVVVCCYDCLGPLEHEIDSRHRVVLLRRKAGFDLGFSRKLAALLRRERIDVLHAHNRTALVYGTLAALRARRGVRVVYTEHGPTHRPSWRERLILKVLSRRVNRPRAVADWIRQIMVSEWGFSAKRTRVVPNGIDSAPFAAAAAAAVRGVRAGLSLPENVPLIGIVASLSPVKNHPVLLRAMVDVVARVPDAQLAIVGCGAEEGRLRGLLRELDLESAVHFLGQLDDVPRLLSALDAFVLCSRSEGMSIALLEAMASGLPIVATRVGGNPELIRHEDLGLLVTSDESSELADGIVRLLTDREAAAAMGARARQEFLSHYTLDAMVDRYVDCYTGDLR